MKNIVLVNTEDEAVMINLDELVYLNWTNETLYLFFKNGKTDIEVDCSEELMSQLVTEIRAKMAVL
jgi:hypothetical protein